MKKNSAKIRKYWHHLTGDAESREVYLDGKWLDPRPSQKEHNHSPDGYNWGFEGSGPAQLALAITLKLTGRQEGYQEFKRRIIAALPQGRSFTAAFTLEGEVKWETTDEAGEKKLEEYTPYV